MFFNTTFKHETGHGESYLWKEKNNPGGIKKTKSEYAIFNSKDDGLNALRELLSEYVEVYGFDYKAIRNRYCPLTDPECANDYRDFMQLMEEERTRFGIEDLNEFIATYKEDLNNE